MYRLFFGAMASWMSKQNQKLMSSASEAKFIELKQALKTRNFDETKKLSDSIEVENTNSFKPIIESFRNVGQEQSETFSYWASFLEGKIHKFRHKTFHYEIFCIILSTCSKLLLDGFSFDMFLCALLKLNLRLYCRLRPSASNHAS